MNVVQFLRDRLWVLGLAGGFLIGLGMHYFNVKL